MRKVIVAGLLVISAVSLLGCASGKKYKTVWQYGNIPSSDTYASCLKYGELVRSDFLAGTAPTPLKQAVVISSPAVTEWEGEITNCSLLSCTVELRETRTSKINRQIEATSENLGNSAYNAGYSIGASLGQYSAKKNAENAGKKASAECLSAAGYRQVKVAVKTSGDNAKGDFMSNMSKVRSGMSPKAVHSALGSDPNATEKTQYGTEEIYCTKKKALSYFYVLRYEDEQLFDNMDYYLSLEDVGRGDCSAYAKQGKYVPFK